MSASQAHSAATPTVSAAKSSRQAIAAISGV